jgi:hypothetical protein
MTNEEFEAALAAIPLEELTALLKVATPEPWETVKMEGFTAVGAKTLIARVFSQAFRDVENETANANLIATLRNHAPQILAVARGAKAALAEKDTEIAALHDDLRKAIEEDLQEELSCVRGDLEQAQATLRERDEKIAHCPGCADYCNLIERQDKQIAEMELALRDISTQFGEPWSQSRAFRGLQETSHVDAMIRERDSLRSQLAAEKNDAGLFHEVVKRLRGAFIVAGLGEWTEWQAAIDLLLKAVQAQAHFAGLASERHDRILELERKVIDAQHDAARWKAAHDGILEEAERMVAEANRGAQEATGRVVSWLRLNMRFRALEFGRLADKTEHGTERFYRNAAASCVLDNTANEFHMWAGSIGDYDPAKEPEMYGAARSSTESQENKDAKR